MDKYDALKLDNQLCFPLYAAAREVIKAYRPALDGLGLTYTQYIAMMVFWEHGKVSAGELGAKLHLDSGTLTPVLKSLEQKGLVRRFRSESDERVLMAQITEKGMAMRDDALAVPAAMACGAKLTPDEAKTLYTLLYKVLK